MYVTPANAKLHFPNNHRQRNQSDHHPNNIYQHRLKNFAAIGKNNHQQSAACINDLIKQIIAGKNAKTIGQIRSNHQYHSRPTNHFNCIMSKFRRFHALHDKGVKINFSPDYTTNLAKCTIFKFKLKHSSIATFFQYNCAQSHLIC